VIDCDGTIWDAEAYLKDRRLRMRDCLLLTAEVE
jgi:hypothetical protein